MNKTHFLESAGVCLVNARRLMTNAELLEHDTETLAAAYALAFLAQEEIAKAFLLYLVYCDALPWNRYVQRSLKDHTCKELWFIVLDALDPDFEEVLARSNDSDYFSLDGFIAKVGDALNWYRYAKIETWNQGYNDWDEDPFNEKVKKISKGKLDRIKQNALYVRIGRDGQVISTPDSIKTRDAVEAIRTAYRFHRFVSGVVENKNHYSRDHLDWLKKMLKCLFTAPVRTGVTRKDIIPGVEFYQIKRAICEVPRRKTKI